jgi:hypothetical protein
MWGDIATGALVAACAAIIFVVRHAQPVPEVSYDLMDPRTAALMAELNHIHGSNGKAQRDHGR